MNPATIPLTSLIYPLLKLPKAKLPTLYQAIFDLEKLSLLSVKGKRGAYDLSIPKLIQDAIYRFDPSICDTALSAFLAFIPGLIASDSDLALCALILPHLHTALTYLTQRDPESHSKQAHLNLKLAHLLVSLYPN